MNKKKEAEQDKQPKEIKENKKANEVKEDKQSKKNHKKENSKKKKEQNKDKKTKKSRNVEKTKRNSNDFTENIKKNITKFKSDIKSRIDKNFKHNKLFKSAKKNLKSKKTMLIVGLILVLFILAIGFNLERFLLNDSGVVARVNGVAITEEELNHKYDFFFFLAGYPESYKQMITKESFLSQLINEELLVQEAVDNGVGVLDKKVEEELDSMISMSTVSRDEFEIQLNNAGFTMKDIFDYYKKQMIITELLNESFSDVEISDAKIEEYYNENTEMYIAGDEEIRLRHILVETEEEAQEILDKLKKGADFVELAREKSIGPSAPNGGDLGFVSKGQMVEEFEKAAFRLNINQLSKVVKTQYGYHIIKREPDKLSLDEAEDSIIELLETEKQKQILGEYLDEIKENSEIIINFGSQKQTTTGSVVSDSCYSDYGLSSDTVIFYHADWCPHCSNMMSVVEKLEEEGYDFHWAETSSKEGVDVVDSCFSNVLQGGVPQFICAGNKEYKLGEISKESLEDFANNCG